MPENLIKNTSYNNLQPLYSNLKNGSKPTYKNLYNKTQKNKDEINHKPKIKIVLDNNTYDSPNNYQDNNIDINKNNSENINEIKLINNNLYNILFKNNKILYLKIIKYYI